MLLSVKQIFLLRMSERNNLLFYNLSMLSFYNFTPVLEYGLVNPDVQKHSGSLLFIKDSIIDKLKTFTSLNQLNVYIITINITFNHSQLLKQRQLSDRTCSNWDNNNNGRSFLPTKSWRALKQRLLRTPELSLVSLVGTRCNKVRYQSSNLALIQNFSVSSPS